ncbi:hypothetical protein [Paraburkholderia sp. D1E]|uniref:hypothetical protein n=1 Tax=Paraburkholderia sp. D1E TaxID=3461398 RepID=UPI00404564B3
MSARETNRPLSATEFSLARWMLEHGSPEASGFLEQLLAAEITPWRCSCGCASVNFQIKGRQPAPPGVRILGEFFFGPNDEPAGIFIFASEGVLSGIEVYGLATDAPTALPREEALRPFPSSSGESSPADGS